MAREKQALVIPKPDPPWLSPFGLSLLNPSSHKILPLSVIFPSWRLPRPFDHSFDHLRSDNLLTFSHADGHIRKQRRVANVAGIRVADDVTCPFMARRVGMTRTHVFGLQGLELLEGTKFVCHDAEKLCDIGRRKGSLGNGGN
jgi:hypothetical protein